MQNAVKFLDRIKPISSEWDAEELLLMTSIIDAFEPSAEFAAPLRLAIRYAEWTVTETKVSVC